MSQRYHLHIIAERTDRINIFDRMDEFYTACPSYVAPKNTLAHEASPCPVSAREHHLVEKAHLFHQVSGNSAGDLGNRYVVLLFETALYCYLMALDICRPTHWLLELSSMLLRSDVSPRCPRRNVTASCKTFAGVALVCFFPPMCGLTRGRSDWRLRTCGFEPCSRGRRGGIQSDVENGGNRSKDSKEERLRINQMSLLFWLSITLRPSNYDGLGQKNAHLHCLAKPCLIGPYIDLSYRAPIIGGSR
jgi:hypothetical protein